MEARSSAGSFSSDDCSAAATGVGRRCVTFRPYRFLGKESETVVRRRRRGGVLIIRSEIRGRNGNGARGFCRGRAGRCGLGLGIFGRAHCLSFGQSDFGGNRRGSGLRCVPRRRGRRWPHRIESQAARPAGTTTAAEHFGHLIVRPAYWSPTWYFDWHDGHWQTTDIGRSSQGSRRQTAFAQASVNDSYRGA